MKNMEEIWVDVINFEGLYKVSNYGIVKGVDRIINRKNGRPLKIKGKNIALRINKDGYYQVQLNKNGKKHLPLLHRVVWESFNGKVPNGLEIGHYDCNNKNNRIDNLYLCSHKENCNHPITRKRQSERMKGNTISKGVISKQKKPIILTNINGIFIKEYNSISECENDGYSAGNVCKCCKNNYIKEGNNVYKSFKWYYKDDYLSN